MNTSELIETATLDIAGLLDEQERQAFEAALASAPPNVQAMVRRHQGRLAANPGPLPSVEPPAGLRSRVMASMQEAVLHASRDLSLDSLPIAGRLRSMPMWRAAAIAFASAAVMLGVYSTYVTQENQRVTAIALSASSEQDFLDVSPRFREIFFAQSKQEFAFVPAAHDASSAAQEGVQARVVFDPDRKLAIVICNNLPINAGEYTLVIQSSAPTAVAQHIKSFEATGGLTGINLDNVTAQDLQQLAILAPADNQGQSATLMRVGGM